MASKSGYSCVTIRRIPWFLPQCSADVVNCRFRMQQTVFNEYFRRARAKRRRADNVHAWHRCFERAWVHNDRVIRIDVRTYRSGESWLGAVPREEENLIRLHVLFARGGAHLRAVMCELSNFRVK